MQRHAARRARGARRLHRRPLICRQTGENRLLKFIHSPKLDLARLKKAHVKRLKRELRRAGRVLIYADLLDISKPRARKMDALFALEGGREILRWILKFAQAFEKEVGFLYSRILRGLRRLPPSLEEPLIGPAPQVKPPRDG
jgi:hypothetical protein